MSEPRGPGDPYSRVEYRRVIAWDRRIAREAPFLERQLAAAPERSVLDVGCGTGEHVAWFARRGARAVGLDRSESMIEAARDHEHAGHGRFVLGEAAAAAALLAGEAPFGLALCLGNMLPHVPDEAALAEVLRAVHAVLHPGGRFVLQLLNYVRIVESGVRHLPVNVRPGDDGREIVFLRLLTPQPHGRMLFFPTTLELDPDAEEPVTVRGTRRVELRAWTDRELLPALRAVGFRVTAYGGMQEEPYEPGTSHDLVLVGEA